VVEVDVLDYYDGVDVSRIYFFWKVGGNGGGVIQPQRMIRRIVHPR
jgi:hypothetical protein